jgi:hypothetical protein
MELNCTRNILSKIDLYNNVQLVSLDCESNQILVLDIHNNNQLKRVYVKNNPLSYICLDSTQESLINNNSFKWEKGTNTSWEVCNEYITNGYGSQDFIPNTLLRIYTTMGVEVSEKNITNGVYIYIYSDGSRKKILK